ncbi:hypothetical protein MUK42_33617 [Musa troglodytarum]|uniref:Uncharacterized protein n=1 Tax=Musa troglodytarum TaxID=320322 RepID=A0A9E7FX12_9LILI|nr:hypothetical protein MUK42_33617 [Musa troglodytarum]
MRHRQSMLVHTESSQLLASMRHRISAHRFELVREAVLMTPQESHWQRMRYLTCCCCCMQKALPDRDTNCFPDSFLGILGLVLGVIVLDVITVEEEAHEETEEEETKDEAEIQVGKGGGGHGFLLQLCVEFPQVL